MAGHRAAILFNGKLFLDRIDETDMHWQSSVIKQIAENRHYLGNTYSHKTRTSLLTKEKNVMLDKEEWIEHMNTHKGICKQSVSKF